MEEYLRRSADSTDSNDRTEDRILELIESTQDTKDKAFLLILLRLNTNMYHNTNIVSSVASKLDKHLTVFEQHSEEESKRVNQGAGVRKVVSYISGIIQTILFAMVIYFQSSLVEIKQQIVQQQITLTRESTIVANHAQLLDQLVQKVNK